MKFPSILDGGGGGMLDELMSFQVWALRQITCILLTILVSILTRTRTVQLEIWYMYEVQLPYFYDRLCIFLFPTNHVLSRQLRTVSS